MHFVSYYYDRDETKSTYYKTCAARVESQLHSYGYKTSFNYINFAERGLNTTYLKLNMFKPRYVLDKMNELNDSVIWIDADCFILEKPTEFDNLNDYDMAFCIREHDNKTPHAAIIYFNNTEKTRKFLLEWEIINREKEKDSNYICSEHCTLIDLLKVADPTLKIKEFRNIARCGVYDMHRHLFNRSGIKIWIGISPDAWEFERSKTQ